MEQLTEKLTEKMMEREREDLMAFVLVSLMEN